MGKKNESTRKETYGATMIWLGKREGKSDSNSIESKGGISHEGRLGREITNLSWRKNDTRHLQRRNSGDHNKTNRPREEEEEEEQKMGLRYIILLSKQGKVRLSKWYTSMEERERQNLVREISALIPLRRGKMCNVIEYKDSKIIYRRYASLFFIVGIDNDDNELVTLDLIQRYVEMMDKAYGNVCELDIVFNFQLAYSILDETIVAGHLNESNANLILQKIQQADTLQEEEKINSKMGGYDGTAGALGGARVAI